MKKVLVAGVVLLGLLGWLDEAGCAQTGAGGAAGASFAVVRVKLSPESEADDWGIGIHGRNFWAVHVTMNELIAWAYGMNVRQVEHAPGWFSMERFDVDGVPEPTADLSREAYRMMLRAALVERCGLRFRSSQKMLPVFVLSVADGGLKIAPSPDQHGKAKWGVHRGWLSITNMTFHDVAGIMQRTIFERPVLDQTGLSGRYTFLLKWRADESQFSQMQGVDVPEEDGTQDVDDIYTASRKTLGIRIEPKKALLPTMVVESVTQPSPN